MTRPLARLRGLMAPRVAGDSRDLALSELVRRRPFATTDKHVEHDYIDYYERWFTPMRDRPITLLEIGVKHGPSIALWHEFFFHNRGIWGLDLHIRRSARRLLHDRRGIHLIEGASDDPRIAAAIDHKFDIIIDDGCHEPDVQRATWSLFFHKLTPGGLYIIEDVKVGADLDRAAAPFLRLWPHAELIDGRRARGRDDNVLLVYRR